MTQPPADGKPQTRAAELTGRVLHLRKLLEDGVQVLGCDADTGIGDDEANPISVLGRIAHGLDTDSPLLGELAGIARQIEECLPDSQRIPLHLADIGGHA